MPKTIKSESAASASLKVASRGYARMRTRREFLKIQRKGIRAFGELLTIHAMPTHFAETPKVGFTVAKTVGKANVRNLVKRRLRHIAKIHKSKIGRIDVILVAKPGAAMATFDALAAEFVRLIENLHQRIGSHSKQRSRTK